MFSNCTTVETVVLLSHKKADTHINVNVELREREGKIPVNKISEKAEKRKPSEKVTNKMIQEYVEGKYGFKVHTAYIAEVKTRIMFLKFKINSGLPMFDSPNVIEELKNSRNYPTPEKLEAIKNALKHFDVI